VSPQQTILSLEDAERVVVRSDEFSRWNHAVFRASDLTVSGAGGAAGSVI
jgi:hypothetical protein